MVTKESILKIVKFANRKPRLSDFHKFPFKNYNIEKKGEKRRDELL